MTKTPKTIVYLRADGNSEIGLGHISRMISLAEILSENFQCKLVTKNPTPGTTKIIETMDGELIEINKVDPEEWFSLVHEGEIVVLDGYPFDTEYQSKIKRRGNPVVCFDDIHSYHFVADIVISPSCLDVSRYSAESYTKVYLGPGYMPLRFPFRVAVRRELFPENNDSLFICMGGADPDNYTLNALKQCLTHDFSKIIIVVGEAYKHYAVLLEAVKPLQKQVELLRSLSPSELLEVMCKCPIAVCSSSSVAYEYLTIGGELYVKQTAPNQMHLYNFLVGKNLAFPLDKLRISKDLRADVLKRQSKVFGTPSHKAILKIFNDTDFNHNTKIRSASENDLMILFEWVNDPELREQSYTTTPISLDTHQSWFAKRIGDANTFIYILEYHHRPFAQVRFEVGRMALVSFSIDRSYRGRGWGHLVLKKAIATFRIHCKKEILLVAYVKRQNTPSMKIFEKLEFIRQISTEYPESYKYEYAIA